MHLHATPDSAPKRHRVANKADDGKGRAGPEPTLTGFVPVALGPGGHQSGRRNNSPPIRRQVLTKLVTNEPGSGEELTVWDVVVGGRSPSPFPGTMGAHSTAWVAHIDAIRRHLVNLPATEGARYLVTLARGSADESTSPLLSLTDKMPQGQKAFMTTAKATMTAAAGRLEALAESADPDDTTLVAAIRELISEYLTYVNYLPTATVKGGDPSGHGEGVARGLLNQFEYICALRKRSTALTNAGSDDEVGPAKNETQGGLLQQALDQLGSSPFGTLIKKAADSNFDPAGNRALRAEIANNLWSMFAAETPGVYAAQTGDDAMKVWKAALQNFLHTIRLAYPYGFDFVEMHTPDAQWRGLTYAMGEAHVQPSNELLEKLEQAITGKPARGVPAGQALSKDESEIRGLDQFAEVAISDLQGGGTGLTVSVLMSHTQVGSIEMTGRTLSPFAGTMGAHTTAWAATLDALRARLTNKEPVAAIETLRKLSTEALSDHRLALGHLIDEKHQFRLSAAYTDLKALANNGQTFRLQQPSIRYLESLVHAHLTYTNLLPLSTIESGGVPGGRAEGKARTFLQGFEANGAAEIPDGVNGKSYVTGHLVAMFDPGGLESFPPDLGDREDPPTDQPDLVGYFQPDQDTPTAEDIAALAIKEFYETVSVAYPKSVAYIGWKFDPADPQLPADVMDDDWASAAARDAFDAGPGGMKRGRENLKKQKPQGSKKQKLS